VYLADGSKQSFNLEGVKELTFTTTDLVVNFNEESTTPVSVPFTNLNFFSLISYTTGIAPVIGTEVEVNVHPNPAVTDVTLKSAKPITSLALYNIEGRKLLQLYPESLEVSVPLTAYPAGLYLLQIVNESGVSINKIIKK
jgi:hypothetical protein